jgi:hypothetical protein
MTLAPNRRRPHGRRPGRGPSLVRAAIALVVALAIVAPAAAEDMPLSADLQLTLFLKMLTYDRHLESRFGTELTIGIVYAPSDPQSVRVANEVVEYLYRVRDKTVKGLPVRYFLVEYSSADTLERSIASHAIDVLYVAPGNARNLDGITKISQEKGLTTMTGVPEYVRRGVAVGVSVSQNRPQLLINLASARTEGAEFDASLLRISTIVK